MNINKRTCKRIIGLLIVVIYLYASYELKVVRGYNASYREIGISFPEILIGLLIVLTYAVTDIYKKLKLRMIIKRQIEKHKDSNSK